MLYTETYDPIPVKLENGETVYADEETGEILAPPLKIDASGKKVYYNEDTGKTIGPKINVGNRTIDQLEQSFANKSSNYWASMRTNIKLMEMAQADYRKQQNGLERVLGKRITALQSELSDILDSGILTYPNTLSEIGLGPDQSLSARKTVFGLRNTPILHNDIENRFLDNMANKADQVRKANWSWRIGEEAQLRHKLGWYPFFVTLTVDPNRTDPKKLWQEGREFRKYIRRLANIVCKELGHPDSHKPPYRPESDYVNYAGVIEHGKSREHHHGHFIIWMRAIPYNWRVCPNTGIPNPANRTKNECLPMRTLWPHSLPGLSPALYFRSIGDIWEKGHSFTLPLKNGNPMKVSKPQIAGYYITKYLSKEHKEWHHRMKSTRNLGMTRLQTFLKNQDQKTIEALTWRAENSRINFSLMKIHTVPLGLLRSEAKRRNYLLQFRAKQLDLTTLLQSNSGIFMRMLTSVRNGIRPDRMDSFQFYDWVNQLLPDQKGYCRDTLYKSHEKLRELFPICLTKTQHTKIGANYIGHT